MKTLVMLTLCLLLGLTLSRPLTEGEYANFQEQVEQTQVEHDFTYQPSPTPWIEYDVPISTTMEERRPWIENDVPISTTMEERRPSTIEDQVPVRPDVTVHAQSAATGNMSSCCQSSSASSSSSSSSSSSVSSSSSQSDQSLSSESLDRQTTRQSTHQSTHQTPCQSACQSTHQSPHQTARQSTHLSTHQTTHHSTQPRLNLEDNPENAAFELTDLSLESVEQVLSNPDVGQVQSNPDVVQYSVSNSSTGQVPEWSLLTAGPESDTETTDNSLESKENSRRGLMLTYQLLRSPLMNTAVEPEDTPVNQLEDIAEKGAFLSSDLPEDNHHHSNQHGYEEGLELGL